MDVAPLRADLRRRAEEHRPGGPHDRHRARRPDRASALPITPTRVRLQGPGRQRLDVQHAADLRASTSPGLVFQWLKRLGGLAAMEKINIAQGEPPLRLSRCRPSSITRPVAKEDRSRMNIPFTLRRRQARRSASSKRREARGPDAAEGPSLGRRHARVDLQRDADRRRAGAGRVHAGVRAQAWLSRFRDPHAQFDLAARPEALPAGALRGRRATSPSPTRSSCARRTCTRMEIPRSVKAIGRAGAGDEQHPGRAT